MNFELENECNIYLIIYVINLSNNYSEYFHCLLENLKHEIKPGMPHLLKSCKPPETS